MRLQTKYYLAWLFILSILVLPEPSISKSLLYLLLSYAAIFYGRLGGLPKIAKKEEIKLEKVRGQWDK